MVGAGDRPSPIPRCRWLHPQNGVFEFHPPLEQYPSSILGYISTLVIYQPSMIYRWFSYQTLWCSGSFPSIPHISHIFRILSPCFPIFPSIFSTCPCFPHISAAKPGLSCRLFQEFGHGRVAEQPQRRGIMDEICCSNVMVSEILVSTMWTCFFCFPYLFCLDLLKIGNIGKPIKSRAGFQPRFLQVDAGCGRLRLPVPWLGEWLGHFWRCWLDPNFFMVNFLITFFFRWNSLCGFIPYVDAGVRPSPRPTPSWTPSIRRASPTSDTRAPSSACPAPKSFLGFRGGKKTPRGTFVIAESWFWIDLSIEIYMYSVYIYICTVYIYIQYVYNIHTLYHIIILYIYRGLGWCFHWYALQCILVFD